MEHKNELENNDADCKSIERAKALVLEALRLQKDLGLAGQKS